MHCTQNTLKRVSVSSTPDMALGHLSYIPTPSPVCFRLPSPHSQSCRCAHVKDPIAAALAKICIYCPNTGNELTGWDGVAVAANMTVRYCPTLSSGKRSKNGMKHIYLKKIKKKRKPQPTRPQTTDAVAMSLDRLVGKNQS